MIHLEINPYYLIIHLLIGLAYATLSLYSKYKIYSDKYWDKRLSNPSYYPFSLGDLIGVFLLILQGPIGIFNILIIWLADKLDVIKIFKIRFRG
jgi:hypothetical protein